jgi:hypothetical protein
MRYDPTDEWELRREIKLLGTRLEEAGKNVHMIPMSELLWSALEKVYERDDAEGLDAIIELEKARGFVEAQQQVTMYLSSKIWVPLPRLGVLPSPSAARTHDGGHIERGFPVHTVAESREGFYLRHFQQVPANPTLGDNSLCLCGFQAIS